MLPLDVIVRASKLAEERGLDVGEALNRWEDAGGLFGGYDAAAWASVAFLLARSRYDPFAAFLIGWDGRSPTGIEDLKRRKDQTGRAGGRGAVPSARGDPRV